MTVLRSIIGGQPVDDGVVRKLADPADLDVTIGEVVDLQDAVLVDEAVARSVASLEAWGALPPAHRGRMLGDAADLLEQRADDIALRATLEEGKALWEARGETAKTIETFRYYAELARELDGRMLFTDRPGTWAQTVPRPVGPCALVTPWNVPVVGPARKLAPALVAGNPCIVKPAALSPGPATMIVEALLEAGVPGDVVQLLHGNGSTIGQALVSHTNIAAVSFTGSTEVGHHLRRVIPPGTRLQAELGGKNPLVVMPDADLDLASQLVITGGLTSTGQMCTATSVVLAAEGIADALWERLLHDVGRLQIGPGVGEGTWMGPLAGSARLETITRTLNEARERGLEIEGGERLGDDMARGCFVTPALIRDCPPTDALLTEEIFGPVIAFRSFRTVDEAFAAVNASRFGLSASICTRDLGLAQRFAREIRAGMIGVNVPTAGWELQLPFGGVKGSGLGTKEQGREGFEFFLVRSTVVTAS
jgi:aldehyde dehydrogenase (NAD+)